MVAPVQIQSPVTSEIYAKDITISWNPIDDETTVIFNLNKYVLSNGVIVPDIPPVTIGSITLDLSANSNITYVPSGTLDPTTGIDLSNVTTAGLLMIIKNAFLEGYANVYGNSQPNSTMVP